ncbi:hypothetical protein [Serratia sp. (in: enterobacteria)]|uniref:hypothetical protein n=1 Tax=Serratia sp. (in: enterobacteria) TaxID=616 RepID=UPI003988B00E
MHDDSSSLPPFPRGLDALYAKALLGGHGISSEQQLTEQYRNIFGSHTLSGSSVSLVASSRHKANEGFMR